MLKLSVEKEPDDGMRKAVMSKDSVEKDWPILSTVVSYLLYLHHPEYLSFFITLMIILWVQKIVSLFGEVNVVLDDMNINDIEKD